MGQRCQCSRPETPHGEGFGPNMSQIQLRVPASEPVAPRLRLEKELVIQWSARGAERRGEDLFCPVPAYTVRAGRVIARRSLASDNQVAMGSLHHIRATAWRRKRRISGTATKIPGVLSTCDYRCDMPIAPICVNHSVLRLSVLVPPRCAIRRSGSLESTAPSIPRRPIRVTRNFTYDCDMT